MNYTYLALARDNTLVQGTIEAGSDSLVEERLLRDGLKLVSVRARAEGGFMQSLIPRASMVSRAELIIFSQQLSILLSAGTPLLSALQLLKDQARSGAFKATVDSLMVDLKAGISLHGAMEKYPQSFPRVYVRLVEAGERSGTLETMLQHLTVYLQREAAAAQQVKKALTYPAIVGVVGIIVLVIMLTVVLPAMAEMLTKLQTDLPLITRWVIGLSDTVQAYKVPGGLAAAAVAGGALWYSRTPQGRMTIARAIISIPWAGALVVRRSVARFSRVMSLLLGAGLPVPDCLALAKDASPNPYFRACIADIRDQVMQGRSLAQGLTTAMFMPGLYVQMVRAGEESGVLEGNLAAMADLYGKDVDDQIATATSLLEPAITFFMGIAVGVIALAVVLPMFSLMNTLRPG